MPKSSQIIRSTHSVTFAIPNVTSYFGNLARSVAVDQSVVASTAAVVCLAPSVPVDQSVASGAGDENLAPSFPIDQSVASGSGDGNLAPAVPIDPNVASGADDGNRIVLAPIDGNRVTSNANGGNPNVLNSSIQIGPPIFGENRVAVKNRAVLALTSPTTSVAPGPSGILQQRTYLPSPARKPQSPVFTTKFILQKPN